MNSHRILITFSILFLFSVGFSQDLLTLYKNYIPESIINNPVYCADVERNLQTYSRLDPNLIYYFIETLNMVSQKIEVSPDSDWRNILQQHLARAKYLKRKWAEIMIANINETFSPPIKCSEIASYYKEYEYGVYKKVIIKESEIIDKNKQNFYKYIYISGQNNLQYNPDEDYSRLYNQAVKTLVGKFNKQFVNRAQLSKIELKELIDLAFKYPYVFKDSYLDDIPYNTSFHIYALINDYVKDKYMNTNSLYVQVADNFLPITYNESIEFTDPFGSKYKYDYQLDLGNTIYVNAGFRVKLKKLYWPFSFINFNVGAAIQKSLSNSFKRHLFFSGYKAKSGLSFDGSYYISDYRDLKSFFITTQISTPVYYISDKIYFEAGINYSMHKISFEYDFNRNGDVGTPYGDDPPAFFQDEVVKYDKTHHLFYPLISVNYFPAKSINIRVDYLAPVQARASVSYYLNL